MFYQSITKFSFMFYSPPGSSRKRSPTFRSRTWFQLRMSRTAGTKRRSQVTRSRSQVTENALKELDTLLCLFICFISGYVTIRHMFGIDHASRCSKSKRPNGESYTLYWNLKSSLPGDLETTLCLRSTRRNLERSSENGTER